MKTLPRLGARPQARPRFALNPVAVLVFQALTGVSAVFAAQAAFAEDVQFNDAFLPEDSQTLDLTAYQQGNPVLPGEYRADVAVNGKLVTRQDIRINADADGSHPTVCFSRGVLELIGVDFRRLSGEAMASVESGTSCLDIAQLIEGATAMFSPSTQQLDISLPQVALRRDARGYVSPELWDRGVTAGTLSYNFNANHNKTDTGNYDSAYLGLNAGLNLGDWRLRHNGSAS